jgi:hypothetical protein
MKRLLFSALMMVCSVSWAGWEYTDKSNEAAFYHDKSTIRQNGAFVQMWSLTDYFEVQTGDGTVPFKSTKELWKYNCNDETLTVLSLIHYSKSEGVGSVTYNKTYKDFELHWVPVVPGTVGKTVWRIACGKK